MRVLYFSNGYSPHDHRFLSALAQTGHKIHYLMLEKQERPIERRPVPAEIEQVPWAGGKSVFRWRDVPALVLDLRRVIAAVKPDLIHAGPIQTCAFLSILSGFRPVLTMSWGFDLMQDAGRDAWWRWVTRYTLRRSTYFVSDAYVTRDRALDYGMRPEHTRVFPWGVDLRYFTPRPGPLNVAGGARQRRKKPASSGWSATRHDASFVMLCNRSWEPRYGVDVLTKAFVRVAGIENGPSLVLLGGGSQAAAIRQILLEAGVLDRVQFGGYVQHGDLLRWYRGADLFISPSHVDGSSVSLMEALACGLPVLVSDIPANLEWVQDGINGWLYPDGNVEALAEKILKIMKRKRRLGSVRRAARRTAEERADWSRNFAALMESYERAAQLR